MHPHSNTTPTEITDCCRCCGASLVEPLRGRTKRKRQFCSILCRNTHNSQQRKREKGIACPGCGHYSYRPKSLYCAACIRAVSPELRESLRSAIAPGRESKKVSRLVIWTAPRLEYLRVHFPIEGPAAVASALDLSKSQVQDKASKLGLRLDSDAARTLIYQVSSERMREDNPMKRPGPKQKMLDWQAANPEKVASIRSKLFSGQWRLQRTKPSKPEHKMRAILTELGVVFEPAAVIKQDFIVDIRIGMTIIQVDGEYWHGHQRFAPLTERQQQQRRRDAAQDKYLVACGYTVLRVWERDVNHNRVRALLQRAKIIKGPS